MAILGVGIDLARSCLPCMALRVTLVLQRAHLHWIDIDLQKIGVRLFGKNGGR